MDRKRKRESHYYAGIFLAAGTDMNCRRVAQHQFQSMGG